MNKAASEINDRMRKSLCKVIKWRLDYHMSNMDEFLIKKEKTCCQKDGWYRKFENKKR